MPSAARQPAAGRLGRRSKNGQKTPKALANCSRGLLCTKTTHVSEWMINSNLPQRLREPMNPTNASWWIVHFKLEEAAIEESTN
jgi:hypothetical protein